MSYERAFTRGLSTREFTFKARTLFLTRKTREGVRFLVRRSYVPRSHNKSFYPQISE
jgi:hypothetical protein